MRVVFRDLGTSNVKLDGVGTVSIRTNGLYGRGARNVCVTATRLRRRSRHKVGNVDITIVCDYDLLRFGVLGCRLRQTPGAISVLAKNGFHVYAICKSLATRAVHRIPVYISLKRIGDADGGCGRVERDLLFGKLRKPILVRRAKVNRRGTLSGLGLPSQGVSREPVDLERGVNLLDGFLSRLDLNRTLDLLVGVVRNHGGLIGNVGHLDGISSHGANALKRRLLGGHLHRNGAVRLNLLAPSILEVDVEGKDAVIGLLVLSEGLFGCHELVFVLVELLDDKTDFLAEGVCGHSCLNGDRIQLCRVGHRLCRDLLGRDLNRQGLIDALGRLRRDLLGHAFHRQRLFSRSLNRQGLLGALDGQRLFNVLDRLCLILLGCACQERHCAEHREHQDERYE